MSQEHVKLLLDAREKIASGKSKYICKALPSTLAGLEIRKQISCDLQGSVALGAWIDSRLYNYPWKDQEKLSATRLAWIDALIEYWSDKP